MESKKNTKKRTLSIRKIAMAGVLVAVAVAGSLISFPVAGSKCAPVQHMVNICAAVFLGPVWGVGVAFCASIIRNLTGLGSLMAFPGSMVGALCCGLMYRFSKNNHTDMYCRDAWHRHTRRSGSVSSCKIRDAYSAGRHVYIHSAIPYLYSGRKHSGSNCHADFKEKWSTDSI